MRARRVALVFGACLVALLLAPLSLAGRTVSQSGGRAASQQGRSSWAPVAVGAGLGSGAVLRGAAGHSAATKSIDLLPGVSTAQIVRIPVAPGPNVPVVVSGLMMSVQAGTGKKYCYDAFYANVGAGCASWTGNGGSNGIWVGPPGWTGDITQTSQLQSLNASGTPAFNPNHIYHLTLNLTGKQLLWAIPHGAVGKDTWSGRFTLDFTGTPTSGGGGGGASPTPPVVVPTPSGFGQRVTAAAPRPGGTAVITSPSLAGVGAVAAPSGVTVDVSGLTVRDWALAAQRTACYVGFTKSLFAAFRKLQKFGDVERQFNAFAGGLLPYFLLELADCLNFVEAVEQTYKAQAGAAIAQASSCAVAPVALSISGSGSKTRLRSFHLGSANDPQQPLRVSCTRQAGKLTITVATRSAHTPLSSIVGSRLQLGIVRSPKDPPGGQLSVVFNGSTSTSGPPNIAGSWVNQQAPTASPPWQLTASNGGQTLDATWTGGAGHTGLHGSFHGSLTQANGTSAYTGTFHITEAGTTVDGTGTFTIDNANQIEINLQPNGQPSMHYTFVRKS